MINLQQKSNNKNIRVQKLIENRYSLMNRYTENELEQVLKYKAEKSSTRAEDEQMNLMSIMSMSTDLMKAIKNQENKLWSYDKIKKTKNKQNQNAKNYDRHCYTQRRNSPQQHVQVHDGLSEFDQSQYMDNQNPNQITGIQKFKFLEMNDLEKSQYVPMKKNFNPNPEKQIQMKKKAVIKKHQNNNKNPTMKTKTNNLRIQTEIKNPVKVQKQKVNPQKSRILNQTYSSVNLTTPIKKFKKHILQAVEIKKQAEEKVYCKTPKHSNIKQFYSQNTDHIPLYEKSKILSAKKLIQMQYSRAVQEQTEIEDATFWPIINRKSQQLIEGSTFYSRLEDTMNRKQTNQGRIMYETMKPCTFVPKLNPNKLTESKIKKIWENEQTNQNLQNSQHDVIQEQDEYEIYRDNYEEKKWSTIKLQKSFAEKMFIG